MACRGKSPLGYALGYRLQRFDMDRSVMYIHDVGVAEACRRRGIGRMIVDPAAQICRDEGFAKMFLGKGKKNLPAVRLYLPAGGQPSPEDDPPEGFWWRFDV